LSKSISNPKKSTENHKKSTDNHKKSTTSPNEKEQKEIKIEAKENLNQQNTKFKRSMLVQPTKNSNPTNFVTQDKLKATTTPMNKLSYDYLSSSTKENTPINNLKDLLNSKKNSVVVSTYKKSSLSSESMLQPQMNFNDDEKNQSSLVRYNCKEILSVYFHMNYLKSFDQPKNFSGESFIKEVMYPLPKPIVECMKKKRICVSSTKKHSKNQN